MIAACPKCGARYRIDDARLPPQGARLRCARCEAVFKVRGAGQARAEALQAPPRAPQTSEPADDRPRELVLIADAEVDSGRATAAALSAWGLRTLLVHDGVEAILSIQRALPRAVVIDAALPKMFGFQICELMKRNESLRHIHVVLVGAIHDRERYRRPPTELYGADAYIERPQIPEGLRPLLERFGLGRADRPRATDAVRARVAPPAPAATPSRPAPPPTAQPVAPPAVQPVAPPTAQPVAPPAAQPVAPPWQVLPPAPAPVDAAQAAAEKLPPGIDPAEVEKAERLARIVVSDIVLYNPEKFEAALAGGNVLEAMANELEEGRSLFRQRVDARVRDSRDFLARELVRVAGQRSPK